MKKENYEIKTLMKIKKICLIHHDNTALSYSQWISNNEEYLYKIYKIANDRIKEFKLKRKNKL